MLDMDRRLSEEMEDCRITGPQGNRMWDRLAAYNREDSRGPEKVIASCSQSFRSADPGGYFNANDGVILDI